MSTVPDPYDALPYERFPIAAMHVDHLATVARLFGLHPRPIEAARVLELGCGSGAHLVPMAAALPGARFVGVDRSPVQIAMARAQAGRLELHNLRFEVADLSDLSGAFGTFDQVLAHGVYSWVPEGVREALMRVVAACLAPRGVACVSYSVLPGAHARLALRDILRWRDDPARPPAERAAEASSFAATLSSGLSDAGPLTPALRRLIGELGGMSDAYVLHDLLAEHHHPVTLSAFVAHARDNGLSYVADAQLHTRAPSPPDDGSLRTLDGLAGGDEVALEQLLDFATQRSFRSSVLCHEAPDRSLGADALLGLYVSSEAKGRGAEHGRSWFRAPGRLAFGVGAGMAAVLDSLEAAAPRPVPIAGLELGSELGAELLALVLADHVALSTGDRGIGGVEGRGFSVARDQVRAGETSVTNLWHRTVVLDRDQRALLPLLDGVRTAAEVLEQVAALRGPRDRRWLDEGLASLSANALLEAPRVGGRGAT